MGLKAAISIGRKRRREGRLWPMPIRETDLRHVYVDVTIRAMGGAKKSWTGRALVDTGATDTFLPARVLKQLGIKPVGKRQYELADETTQMLAFGLGAIEILGEVTGGALVFAGEHEEPLLGVTVLESTGFVVDPRRETLLPRMPKRKRV